MSRQRAANATAAVAFLVGKILFIEKKKRELFFCFCFYVINNYEILIYSLLLFNFAYKRKFSLSLFFFSLVSGFIFFSSCS